MTMVESEQAQKSGIIGIGYEIGRLPIERYEVINDSDSFDMASNDGGFDRELARGLLNLPLGIPVRFASYHICADAPQWQGISDMVLVTLCKVARLRFRFHYGKFDCMNSVLV